MAGCSWRSQHPRGVRLFTVLGNAPAGADGRSLFWPFGKPISIDAASGDSCGSRDFDEAETAFIKASQIAAYAVSDIRSNVDTIRKIAESIKTAHVYIHLDLDVMDPGVFPNTPLPVDGGLCPQEVWDIFHLVAGQTVGLGIYEYAPSGTKDDFVEKLISFGLNRSIPA